jgi:hypothetical protein
MAERRKQPKQGTYQKPGIIMGRNNQVVPLDDVEMWASLGCNDKEIADYYGVNEDTFRYNCSEALLRGRHQLKTSLRKAQIKVALGGNSTMLIWLGKNILGQSDAPTNSADKQPLPWNDDISRADIEDELETELEEIESEENNEDQ